MLSPTATSTCMARFLSVCFQDVGQHGHFLLTNVTTAYVRFTGGQGQLLKTNIVLFQNVNIIYCSFKFPLLS